MRVLRSPLLHCSIDLQNEKIAHIMGEWIDRCSHHAYDTAHAVAMAALQLMRILEDVVADGALILGHLPYEMDDFDRETET